MYRVPCNRSDYSERVNILRRRWYSYRRQDQRRRIDQPRSSSRSQPLILSACCEPLIENFKDFFTTYFVHFFFASSNLAENTVAKGLRTTVAGNTEDTGLDFASLDLRFIRGEGPILRRTLSRHQSENGRRLKHWSKFINVLLFVAQKVQIWHLCSVCTTVTARWILMTNQRTSYRIVWKYVSSPRITGSIDRGRFDWSFVRSNHQRQRVRGHERHCFVHRWNDQQWSEIFYVLVHERKLLEIVVTSTNWLVIGVRKWISTPPFLSIGESYDRCTFPACLRFASLLNTVAYTIA